MHNKEKYEDSMENSHRLPPHEERECVETVHLNKLVACPTTYLPKTESGHFYHLQRNERKLFDIEITPRLLYLLDFDLSIPMENKSPSLFLYHCQQTSVTRLPSHSIKPNDFLFSPPVERKNKNKTI